MKKQIFVLEYELPITIIPLEEGGYLARCEKLQGCMAEGKTIEKALEVVTDVARGIISLHKEENLPIPLRVLKKINTASNSYITVPLIYQTSHA
ncbi:MAG TPA: type II toxin-antitoxin system HicB family antitoxin [Candidatus Saccharimonadales bacterium]|nr:type II toxin-antitoxin system HicB family antitoxin [Candidatus Saccharimonadales bacterium]